MDVTFSVRKVFSLSVRLRVGRRRNRRRRLSEKMVPTVEERFFYTVAWSDEDDAFIGRVAEFP